MPMITKSMRQKILITSAAALSLYACPSYAGFQYVPTAPVAPTVPSAPVAPVTPEATDPLMTPGPQAATNDATAPTAPSKQATQSQPVQQTSAPVVSSPQPETPHMLVIPAKDMPLVKPQAPSDAPKVEAQPILKTITVTPSAKSTTNDSTPMPIAAEERTAGSQPKEIMPVSQTQNGLSDSDIHWNPAASKGDVNASTTPAPIAPIAVTPQPVQTEMAQPEKLLRPIAKDEVNAAPKVIMSSDAPSNAVNAVPNSEKLVINPFPDISKGGAGSEESAAPEDDTLPPEPVDAKSAAAKSTSTQTTLAKIDGFGSDMPLALALQQIAPSSYTFAYDQSVNPGVRVSWEGKGKEWDQVINDMLQPMNLHAELEGKVVRISHIDGAAPTMPEPSQSSAPAKKENVNKQSAAQPAPSKSNVASSAPTAPATKLTTNDLRRNAVRDPGPTPGLQPSSSMVNIESSSGENAPATSTKAAPIANDKGDIKPLLDPMPPATR